MIAREARMFAGLRRQVWGGRSERLNARLLVIRDDRHFIAGLLFCGGRGLSNELDLAIDAQNLRHLLFELRVASFQVIAHLVRFYFLPIEYVAQRALSQFGKAAVPLCRALLARMAGEESRCPQFVRIPEFLGLAAGEVHNPSLGFGRDRGLLAGPGSIIERRHRAIGQRSLNTALNRLMVHPDVLRHRKKGGVLSVRQQHRARSTRLAGSVRERAIALNAAKSFSPMANSIACRHAVMSATLSANQSRKARTHVGKWESSPYDGFYGIDILGRVPTAGDTWRYAAIHGELIRRVDSLLWPGVDLC